MGNGQTMARRQFTEKLSAQDVARIFGVTHTTVHRWVKKRGLPYQKTIGGRLRFIAMDIRRYCEQKNLEVPDELMRLTRGQMQHG